MSGAGRPVGTGAVPRLATEVLRKPRPARFAILPLEQQDRKLRSAWVCQVDNSEQLFLEHWHVDIFDSSRVDVAMLEPLWGNG